MPLILLFALAQVGQDLAAEPKPSQPVLWVVIDRPQSTLSYADISLQLLRLKDGTYFACFENALDSENASATYVHRSWTRGKSWSQVAKLEGLANPSLFADGNDLYVQGTDGCGADGRSRLVILRSIDQGTTWSTPRDELDGVLFDDVGDKRGTAAMLAHGGRFWRPFIRDPHDDEGRLPRRYVTIASAPVDSDLLRSDSWRWSEEWEVLDRNWRSGSRISLHSDSETSPLLLSHSGNGGIVTLARLSPDGATFQSREGSCSSYYTNSEHVAGERLLRDPLSGDYFAVRGSPSYLQREMTVTIGGRDLRVTGTYCRWNAIELASSTDLHGWDPRSTLLRAPAPSDPDFESCDWLIEDQDLLVLQVARFADPAEPSENPRACELIFYRVPNFRERRPDDAPLWAPATPK